MPTNLPSSVRNQIPESVQSKLSGMDATVREGYLEEFRRRRKSAALGFVLANIGLHYAYLGRVWLTLLFFFTMGGLGVWWFVDLFRIWSMVRDRNRSIAIQVLRDVQFLQ